MQGSKVNSTKYQANRNKFGEHKVEPAKQVGTRKPQNNKAPTLRYWAGNYAAAECRQNESDQASALSSQNDEDEEIQLAMQMSLRDLENEDFNAILELQM